MRLNGALPSVDPSHFAMVPRSDVPRSKFKTTHTHKMTFDMGYLVPCHIEEVLPGGVYQGQMATLTRLNNLIFPLMDNARISSFFFFIPSRILWVNFEKFMGAQDNPSDSISFTIPQSVSPVGGFAVGSIFDFFGLPTVGQVTAGKTVSVNSLPLRAYNKTINSWFRDEDVDTQWGNNETGNGPDNIAGYALFRRRKRHDYFTSARPWPLKGGVDVTLPSGGNATVKTNATALFTGAQQGMQLLQTTGATPTVNSKIGTGATGTAPMQTDNLGGFTGASGLYPSNLYADLSTAVAPTINAMRLAVASQQFLEKDARGGTRYTELLQNHFGVHPQDARLQRPEYIGGGVTDIQTQAIPQTSATGLTGGTTPVGALTAQAVAAANHAFSYHAVEHGYILGLVCVDADITYQQGLHRMWTRLTRFDFYWPTFANLGEQAIRNDEIFVTGDVTDTQTFGYQERWAEYRYYPSRISNLFRSTAASNIDEWHLAQQFVGLPTLNSTFLMSTPPASRVLAAGAAANGMQILFDSFFSITRTLPLPTYSVPGLTRF